jgi:DNA-binding transcriptional regulator GbsR (MarR family)
MEYDLFFSAHRWDILEILAKKPSSPIEISEQIKTSVSYVSQQLKLLEAANLITKNRTGLIEKGKPRNVFSLSKEILHLSALMNRSPAKKLIYLTDYHNLILRIWLLENLELHYLIEKLYWKVEEEINQISAILVDISSKKPRVLIVSDSKKLRLKLDSFVLETEKKIDCLIISQNDLKKLPKETLHPIYDPNALLLEEKLKGGNEK